jgi:hypothetical protein
VLDRDKLTAVFRGLPAPHARDMDGAVILDKDALDRQSTTPCSWQCMCD